MLYCSEEMKDNHISYQKDQHHCGIKIKLRMRIPHPLRNFHNVKCNMNIEYSEVGVHLQYCTPRSEYCTFILWSEHTFSEIGIHLKKILENTYFEIWVQNSVHLFRYIGGHLYRVQS